MPFSLFTDDEAYNRGLKAYNNWGNKLDFAKKFIEGTLSARLEGLLLSPQDEHAIRILTVGSGNGVQEIVLLHQLLRLFPNNPIQMVVVEPVQANIEAFKAALSGEETFGGRVCVEWRLETSQKFRETFPEHPQARFDLVLWLQSIYFEDEVDTPLAFSIRLLTDRGILLIAIDSTTSSFAVLGSLGFVYPFVTQKFHSPEDIARALQDLAGAGDTRVVQVEVEEFSNLQPADALLDMQSEEGAHITDFITQCLHFREAVSPEFLDAFLNTIRKQTVIEGKVYMKWSCHCFIVKRGE